MDRKKFCKFMDHNEYCTALWVLDGHSCPYEEPKTCEIGEECEDSA